MHYTIINAENDKNICEKIVDNELHPPGHLQSDSLLYRKHINKGSSMCSDFLSKVHEQS